MLQATPTNHVQVNRAISLVLSAAQVLRDRLAADEEKHLMAQTLDYGWTLVSNMDGLEGQVGRISMTALRSQEKAYLAHKDAVDAVNKPSYSEGRGGKFQTKGKPVPNGKGKGKGKKPQNKTKEGGLSKPKRGGCHRCDGPYFVRACPKPVVQQ